MIHIVNLVWFLWGRKISLAKVDSSSKLICVVKQFLIYTIVTIIAFVIVFLLTVADLLNPEPAKYIILLFLITVSCYDIIRLRTFYFSPEKWSGD